MSIANRELPSLEDIEQYHIASGWRSNLVGSNCSCEKTEQTMRCSASSSIFWMRTSVGTYLA